MLMGVALLNHFQNVSDANININKWSTATYTDNIDMLYANSMQNYNSRRYWSFHKFSDIPDFSILYVRLDFDGTFLKLNKSGMNANQHYIQHDVSVFSSNAPDTWTTSMPSNSLVNRNTNINVASYSAGDKFKASTNPVLSGIRKQYNIINPKVGPRTLCDVSGSEISFTPSSLFTINYNCYSGFTADISMVITTTLYYSAPDIPPFAT